MSEQVILQYIGYTHEHHQEREALGEAERGEGVLPGEEKGLE